MPITPSLFAAYKKQMLQSDLRLAYQSLLQFIMDLRVRFESHHPDFAVSGSVYPGVMDMTFFCFADDFLKQHKLKITLVFLHDKCRFELWLSGANRAVQSKCWKALKDSNFTAYPLVDQATGVDSIAAHLLPDPDFSNPPALADTLEKESLAFLKTITPTLKKLPNF